MFVALTEPELADRRVHPSCCISSNQRAGRGAFTQSGKLPGVTQVVVPDAQVASALMAARFYGEPESLQS